MEQLADLSLKGLFEQFCPIEDFRSVSWGYFVQNDVLVRQWVPYGDKLVGVVISWLVG